MSTHFSTSVGPRNWLKGDQLKDPQAQATAGQQLPYNEIILYAYAADRTNRPTYVCLPSGLYNASVALWLKAVSAQTPWDWLT